VRKIEWLDKEGNVDRTEVQWNWFDRLQIWTFGKIYAMLPDPDATPSLAEVVEMIREDRRKNNGGK
jgi:hypothetical protein